MIDTEEWWTRFYDAIGIRSSVRTMLVPEYRSWVEERAAKHLVEMAMRNARRSIEGGMKLKERIVAMDEKARASKKRDSVWTCKIGVPGGEAYDALPPGADMPMRNAAFDAFRAVTGREAKFCFSGWGYELTDLERSVAMDEKPEPFVVDPSRVTLPETGYFVRATLDGAWGSHDIAHLTRESLERWLRRSETTAVSVVMGLLGHPSAKEGT